jgi:hypothetical protein
VFAGNEWQQHVTLHSVQDTFNKLDDYKVFPSWSYPVPGRLGRATMNVMRRKTGKITSKGPEYETVTLDT